MGEVNSNIIRPGAVNLNTIVIVVGFLATFTAIIFSYADVQNSQKNFNEFVTEQKVINAQHIDRMDHTVEQVTKDIADIRAQIGMIALQVALNKQSIDLLQRDTQREPGWEDLPMEKREGPGRSR